MLASEPVITTPQPPSTNVPAYVVRLESPIGAKGCSPPHFWAWALVTTAAATTAMFIGHQGEHSLDWRFTHISTYAAIGPLDNWVTTGMVLAACALVLLALELSHAGPMQHHVTSHLIALLLGAAAGGVLELAWHEASRTDAWRKGLHDGGVHLFMFSTVSALLLGGTMVSFTAKSLCGRFLGLVIGSSGPLALVLSVLDWTTPVLGLHDARGIRQRSSFATLSIGLLLLTLITRHGMGSKTKQDSMNTKIL